MSPDIQPVPVPFLYRFIYTKLREKCDANLCLYPGTARQVIHHMIFGLDYDHIMFLLQEFKAYGFIERIEPTAIKLVEVKW